MTPEDRILALRAFISIRIFQSMEEIFRCPNCKLHLHALGYYLTPPQSGQVWELHCPDNEVVLISKPAQLAEYFR